MSFTPYTILTAEDLNAAFADKANTTDVNTALAAKIPATEKGAANGVASLGGDGKTPTAQLPDAVIGAMKYQGTWNAGANNPTIPAASNANKGHVYIVSVAGDTNIDGENDWQVKDWIVSTGAAWIKVDNSPNVLSVAGKTGVVTLIAADVGLGNVNNTSDADKPVSTAQQTALDAKQTAIDAKLDKAGGTLTGPVNEAQAASIAAATTINLTTVTGNLVHVTGVTSISAITLAQGAERTVVFDGVLTLIAGANLILPTGAGEPTAPGDSAIFRGEASGVVRCVSYQKANGLQTAPVSQLSYPTYMHVRDEKASGTDGGSSVAGSNLRTLNTVTANTINGASLSSNMVTLPAGTYKISARAPAYKSDEHKLTLVNHSSSATMLVGSSAICSSSYNGSNDSTITPQQITLLSTTQIKLIHLIGTAKAANGLGSSGGGLGTNEVFAEMLIERLY